MSKSKFFRSADSSGSDTDSDSSENDTQAEDLTRDTALQNLAPSQPLTSDITTDGRNWLLHSLLEERCLNQVRSEQGHDRSERELRAEAQRRYRALVTHLAPLNLVSAGLEDDHHRAMRQNIRNLLDSVDLSNTQALQVATRDQAHQGPPAPLNRMLTDGMPTSSISSMLFDSLGKLGQPATTTRYMEDFEELGPLGKGGYGEVFRVRHLLDKRVYAVKKVPIRSAMISRIMKEGKPAMDEVLVETETLAKLDHPNIVRYFSSWIEWSNLNDPFFENSNLGGSSDQSRAVVGAAEYSTSASRSLHRVRTESDGVSENIFESRSHHNITPSMSANEQHDEDPSSRSVTGAELESITGPRLTLHMQMDVYPMTLADFISPKPSSTGIQPLSHCFHLETSIQLVLAILDGVEYLHSQNMVHRDLKPANIFLRHDNSPKATHCVDLFLCSRCRQGNQAQPAKLNVRIGDFGLVTKLTEEICAAPSVAGTELYRPKASGAIVGPQLDIHATAVIACELLCRFGTQMERRQTLHGLRDGHLPSRFATCTGAESAKIKECIEAMLAFGGDNISMEETKRRLSSLIAPHSLSAMSASDMVARRSSA